MKLKNRLIVITGGTSGIGYQMVRYLYLDNRLIVIGRDADKLQKLCDQLPGVMTYQADLSQPEQVEAVADAIVKRFPSIDLLINNAAVQYTPTFLDDGFEYGRIAEEVNVNFTSLCCLTYRLLPVLQHREQAVILNINSGLALAPKTSSAVYCATKAALNIFTQSLRYQLTQTNIRVQQVFLELVDTAMTQGRGSKKMSADRAAKRILVGIELGINDHDIGKVKLLRLLLRVAPSLARRVMKKY